MTSFKWGAALPPQWVDLLCNKDNLQKLSTTQSQLSTELHWREYKNKGLHCKLSSAEVCNAHCALFCKGGHYCNAYRPVAKTQLAELASFPFCNLKKYNLQFDKYVRIMPRSAAGLLRPKPNLQNLRGAAACAELGASGKAARPRFESWWRWLHWTTKHFVTLAFNAHWTKAWFESNL